LAFRFAVAFAFIEFGFVAGFCKFPRSDETNVTPARLSTSSQPITMIWGAFAGVRFPGGAGEGTMLFVNVSGVAGESVVSGLQIVGPASSGGGTGGPASGFSLPPLDDVTPLLLPLPPLLLPDFPPLPLPEL
jgi:hypothetical protein